ncbi:uncharacterized protein LOC124439465 [Xenia sp. Carnegie-2017]|uniref:uncharacterized protein LOC124439465 n=1 Tax=Xenia sp. Carnegie-2017 TaxID=2897299 RepID=UPI001F0351EF|nr:uncharacterized protein LOC124439465 [Xenia sp. Carnegie-2017]
MTVNELDLSNPQSSTNSQSHTKLREELEMLKKELKKAKENHNNLANNISALFNEDQIAYLSKRPGYGKVWWSNNTIESAIQIRYSCGATGYSTLLGMNYPLPSIRTLNRRMEHIEFSSGLTNEVFAPLQLKVNLH